MSTKPLHPSYEELRQQQERLQAAAHRVRLRWDKADSRTYKAAGFIGSQSRIVAGLHESEFRTLLESLPEPVRERIIRSFLLVLSRSNEASFRRGFQHGHEFTRDGLEIVDPVMLRFFTSLDISPDTIRGHHFCTTAIDRLFMEFWILDELGLPRPVDSGDKKRPQSPARLRRSKAPRRDPLARRAK